MKFSELRFTNFGCCVGATRAEVTHANGFRTEIHDCDDDNETGPYTVITWSGPTTAHIAALQLADQAAVEARLASDAEIQP